ncbi:HD domain-containing protein [Phytopseudomonas daroniae]|uniref:HD domain-containing protein n=1 Tax=Phytopseudomonas daroniae TaxID=2487519 RepID=UPI003CC57A92
MSVADHACASAALLWEHLPHQDISHLLWIRHALQAISAHHGYNFNQTEFNRAIPSFEPPAWSEARKEIFAAYWAVPEPSGTPQLEALSQPAVQWLAGERCESLTEHYADAGARADRGSQAIGWRPPGRGNRVPPCTRSSSRRCCRHSG